MRRLFYKLYIPIIVHLFPKKSEDKDLCMVKSHEMDSHIIPCILRGKLCRVVNDKLKFLRAYSISPLLQTVPPLLWTHSL